MKKIAVIGGGASGLAAAIAAARSNPKFRLRYMSKKILSGKRFSQQETEGVI